LTRFATMHMAAGDAQVPNTPAAYGEPAFEALLAMLRPRLAEATGRALHPTYSYFRIYKRGDALRPHRDRPACEFSVSLNIDHDADQPWPLCIEGFGATHEARLAPGDALLYRGRDCRHWRAPFQGRRSIQAFLHYVDAEGPYADWKYDRRAALMTVPSQARPQIEAPPSNVSG
jgi:alkylated DNA repair dioxygenase AlkB